MEHNYLIMMQKKRFDTFVKMSKINIQYVDQDLSWLKQLCGVL